MNNEALSRFRKVVAKGDFTLTQIAEATGIPITTLSDMSDAKWRPKILDRFDKLEAGLDKLEAPPKSKSSNRKGGAHATA